MAASSNMESSKDLSKPTLEFGPNNSFRWTAAKETLYYLFMLTEKDDWNEAFVSDFQPQTQPFSYPLIPFYPHSFIQIWRQVYRHMG